MIGHPGEQRLLGFLDGDLADGERQRIARHLAGCQRCRDVIQGHRAVRAVLRLEPLPASGGVLGRILDTREGGGAVVLPAVDPEPGHSGRPGYLTLLVSAAAVLVVALVQLVPATPFQAAWQWWSRTVAEFGGGEAFGGFELRGPLMPVPIAEPAKLDPKKLRPMTVRYRYINRGATRAPIVDSAKGFSLQRAPKGGGWLLESLDRNRSWSNLVLDPITLSPQAWDYSFRGSQYALDYRITMRNGWRRVERMVTGQLPRGLANITPGIDSTPITGAPAGPMMFGWYSEVLLAQLTTVSLHQGWSGSFARIPYNPTAKEFWSSPTSYMVEGDATVKTPAGTFDTWEVHEFSDGGDRPYIFWLRKSDGLMVKWGCEGDDLPCDTQELLSVTYP